MRFYSRPKLITDAELNSAQTHKSCEYKNEFYRSILPRGDTLKGDDRARTLLAGRKPSELREIIQLGWEAGRTRRRQQDDFDETQHSDDVQMRKELISDFFAFSYQLISPATGAGGWAKNIFKSN